MWQFLIPAATAALGAQRAQRQADQKERFNKAQAEITKYSPWTGMRGQLDSSYSPSSFEGGLAGGLQGLGMAQGFGMFANKPQSIGGMQSGLDQNIVDEQNASPWELFAKKRATV